MTVVGDVLPGSSTHVLLASALVDKCRSKWGDKDSKTREAVKEAFNVSRGGVDGVNGGLGGGRQL
jgi:hypothetical protein